MRIVVLDYETFFDRKGGYTLNKMTTESYIRDPRFEAHGASIKWSANTSAQWYDARELKYRLAQEDWSDTFLIAHHCVPGDTEVLTKKGWHRIDALALTDDVMQWDAKTGRLSWVIPIQKIERHATKLLSWQTQFHCASYTPEHRMIFTTPDKQNRWFSAPAEALNKKQPNNVYIPLAGMFEDANSLALTPRQAAFMEVIRADGAWNTGAAGVRFRLKKLRKIQRLAALLLELEIPYRRETREGVEEFHVWKHPCVDQIYNVLGWDKKYGQWVTKLSIQCRQAILLEAQYWDGHHGVNRAANSYTLSSKHKEVVDAFQLMAHLTGWSAQTATRENKRGFTKHIDGAVLHHVSVRPTNRAKLVQRATEQTFNGSVFCLTVPTGAFLMRANGRVIVTGNCQFDGLILSHHYDVHPKMLGCTLSMARLLLGNHLSVSLDNVRKHFGMPSKCTPYHLFDGKHWSELTEAVRQELAAGCCDEVESIWTIFGLLMKQGFPREELEVVDITLKMFTEPRLVADMQILANVWRDEAIRKQKAMADLNVTEAELQSAEKFAELLRAEGVEIGYKPSPKHPDKTIYAFAKTDQFMRDLLEDEDDRIRTLAEARLGQKSNIMQTRAETLGRMGRRGPLCVYLRYAGAGTLRVAGGDGANWLNFKRRSPIRKAILAPEGYLLAPVDSAQIECRVLHFLAGGVDEPVVRKFRAGEDPYVDQATRFYGEQIYKPGKDDPRKDEMEAKRGMGKQGRLMCGFGAAGPKFKITAKNGLYGPSVDIPLEEATRFVKLYRQDNPSICAKQTGYWAQASRMLSRLAGGDPCDWGPLHVENHRIYVPNGAPMIYDTLEYYKPPADEQHKYKPWEWEGFWRVKTRQGWKTMHGPKLTQNICEAVSRLIVSQAAIRIARAGYRILNWPYDELLCLIPRDSHEDRHVEFLLSEMRREPVWLPGIPLDAEVTVGERYSK